MRCGEGSVALVLYPCTQQRPWEVWSQPGRIQLAVSGARTQIQVAEV